jgi:alkaline phosphatase D
VDVKELEPSVSFWYRFRAGKHTSPVGRMATTPLFTLPDRAVIGTLTRRSDASLIAPLLADLASSGLDLVVDLGDPVAITEGTTLEEYRVLHANLLADPSSRAARAACAWLAIPNSPSPSVEPEAALRAWWEHTPVRLLPPNSGDPYPAYRHCLVGSLVDVALLDPTVDGSGRKRLGRAQERWLTREPARANAAWHAVAYRGDTTVGERATQLLTGASIRNVVDLPSTGNAPSGAVSWQRHEVTPERWTSVTHLLDVATGAVTTSHQPTVVVATPSPSPTG